MSASRTPTKWRFARSSPVAARVSKCKVCREPAIIDLPRHNANFCGDHLQQLCRRQVEKAISDFEMLRPEDRVLVAVSGGKDSLAVWDILVELGYHADGLYIGLGIGDYSDVSGRYVRAFADERGLTLRTIDLREDYGYDVPTAARRDPPGALFGVRALEAAPVRRRRPRWRLRRRRHRPQPRRRGRSVAGQHPAVGHRLSRPPAPGAPGHQRLPKKAKPLVRLTEREMAAWCIVRGIDYQVEECPMAAGNRHLGYKETLNQLEARVARDEGVVLPVLPRPHGADPRWALAGGDRRFERMRTVRRTDHRRGVCVLPIGRHRIGARTGPRRDDRTQAMNGRIR